MKSVDIVTVGNATIDAFLKIHEASVHCRLTKEESELCFKNGQKIPVESSEFRLGGNACNVAVGLSRLGFKSALMAEIGDDEFSNKIIKGLTAENVLIDHLQISKDAPTTFAVGIQFKGERTLFVQHGERKHNFDFSSFKTEWVYLTSLGNEWKTPYKRVLELVRRNNLRLAFNPGSYQMDEGFEAIEKAIKVSEILFLNKEEANRLLFGNSVHKHADSVSLLRALQESGAKIVVITDGKQGTSAIDKDGNIYTQEAKKVDVVEKTGAGDGFASGFLGAILHKKSIEEALEWGSRNSASVIGKVGAQPGLLTKSKIQSSA